MMEAASTSETSVNFYQTTRRNTPEDSHLHTRRRENLESHYTFFFVKAPKECESDIIFTEAFTKKKKALRIIRKNKEKDKIVL
jgi:hypothetical protein